MDTSKCRQQLKELSRKHVKYMDRLLGIKGLIKGGFYKTKLKCGKKGCRCAKGELHEVWMFYRSEGGKTRIRTMNREAVENYGRYTINYQKYRHLRAELVKLHKQEVRLIDLIEESMRKEDRKTEQKLLRRAG